MVFFAVDAFYEQALHYVGHVADAGEAFYSFFGYEGRYLFPPIQEETKHISKRLMIRNRHSRPLIHSSPLRPQILPIKLHSLPPRLTLIIHSYLIPPVKSLEKHCPPQPKSTLLCEHFVAPEANCFWRACPDEEKPGDAAWD